MSIIRRKDVFLPKNYNKCIYTNTKNGGSSGMMPQR